MRKGPGKGTRGAVLTRHVVHNHRHRRVADVAWNQAAEPLLPSGVPKLQTDLLA
jgi:hypothetical protein